MEDQNRKLAGLILNCKPAELKGVTQRADGSLAVVAPNGMKFIFSPVELDNARDSFGLPPSSLASIPAQQISLRGTSAGSTSEAAGEIKNVNTRSGKRNPRQESRP